jgi:hypothetical protein
MLTFSVPNTAWLEVLKIGIKTAGHFLLREVFAFGRS